MIKIAICDDEQEMIERQKEYLAQLKESKAIEWAYEVDVFESGEELLAAQTEYDIILLDMEMNKMNGIETANKIRERNRGVFIIFVTSHTKYMRSSFECQPFQFLVKPVDFKLFEQTIQRAGEYIIADHPIFTFEENKNVVKVLYNDIAYFEKIKHQLHIVMFDGQKYTTYITITQLKKEIDMKMFAVTHKSYVVNMKHVKELKGNVIKLRNGMAVPVSRTYKQEVREKLIVIK